MDKTKNNNTSAISMPSSAMTDLKIAQINLLHCKKASYTYCHDFKVEHTDVSLIQEPWIRGNKIHGFGKLHNRLFYCRTGGKPRAAIHVSPNVNAMILNQFTDLDLVTVRIYRKSEHGGDFIVVSAYMPYDSPLPPPGVAFKRIVDFCSSNINKRGEDLIQFLVTIDLMVINKGKKPTFVNSVRKEILDVTLASCGLSEMIHSWRVTDEETFPDHKLIKFSLRGHFPQKQPYRNPRKTNWELFRKLLKRNLNKLVFQDRYFSAEEEEKAQEGLEPGW